MNMDEELVFDDHHHVTHQHNHFMDHQLGTSTIVENPFRPNGDLSSAVDPIVDAFKVRPYPHQPDLGSPTIDHKEEASNASLNGSAITDPRNYSNNDDVPLVDTRVTLAHDGVRTEQTANMSSEQGQTRGMMSNGAQSHTDNSTAKNGNTHPSPTVAEIQHRTITTPQAGKAEMVRVEEDTESGKKKGCCSCCVVM